MPVYATITTVFVELFLVTASVIAFVLFGREFAKRRQAVLLYYCFAFLSVALSCIALFGGQTLAANGRLVTAMSALKISSAIGGAFGFFLAVAATANSRKSVRVLVGLASLALLGTSLSYLSYLQPGIVQINGASFAVLTAPGYAITYGPLIVAFLSLVATRIARHRRHVATATDALMLYAGFFGILSSAFSVAGAALHWRWVTLPVLILYAAFLTLLLVGSHTESADDPELRRHPTLVFRRSLLVKAVSLNTLALWVLTAVMLAVISSAFVGKAANDRVVAMQRSLHYNTKAFEAHVLLLADEANRLAADPRIVSAFLAPTTDSRTKVDSALLEIVGDTSANRSMRLVGADGVVRYSSVAVSEVDQRMADSRVVAAGLRGERLANVETDTAFNLQMLRTSVPVRSPTGELAGFVLHADVDSAFSVADYDAIAPVVVTGAGFVASGGEIVSSVGETPDAEERDAMRRYLPPRGIGTFRSPDDAFYVERTSSVGGTSPGFFYVFVSDSEVDATAFKIIALVSIISLFVSVFMVALLLAGMGAVLRPLQELRNAAALVQKGRFDSSVSYDSPDELGQLSSAFNGMLKTIAVRTAELQGAVRERQNFLENATRELRKPLHIFRWSLETMRFGEAGRLNKRQMELVEQLHQTNERMAKMVQNLQDVTAIDKGDLVMHRRGVAIEDVIDDALGQVAVFSRGKDITLHWVRPAVPVPKVYADPAFIAKVLHNLVQNAVKYTQRHGRVELRVETVNEGGDPAADGGFVKTTIEDNGIGIPQDDSKSVFNRFFRARNITGFEVEGTGLGLYLAKRLVELHGGSIGLESREGVGTTVSFILPAESSTNKPSPKK